MQQQRIRAKGSERTRAFRFERRRKRGRLHRGVSGDGGRGRSKLGRMTYTVDFHPGKGRDRYYLIDGEREIDGREIKSVTTVLSEIGDRFGVAAWWGMQVGVKGLHTLMGDPDLDVGSLTPEECVPLLTKHKLTTNHTRDDAASRGTIVHAIAEDWAEGADFWPDDYPAEKGWVEGLCEFIHEENITPLESEVRVGSKQGAYAGTFDLWAEGELTTWDGKKLSGKGIIDYKSKSKPPKKKHSAYESNHLQLRAYELARVEMGMEPADFLAVVNIYPDGTYGVIESVATEDQWGCCLSAYRSLMELKAEMKVAA